MVVISLAQAAEVMEGSATFSIMSFHTTGARHKNGPRRELSFYPWSATQVLADVKELGC